MENILVTGANGQLGYDVVRELKERKLNPIATDRALLDITDENSVKDFFMKNKIDACVHTAAYTKVDKAEEEVDICEKINVKGTENIVLECKKYNIPIMYFSTDYVFSGEGNMPYKIGDITNPLGVYAKTKYEGEKIVSAYDKHFIIRISWVFGINGKNFIKTMIELSKTKNELRVVSDQIGSPTYTYDLSKLISNMILTDKYGIYHATNEGYVSWSDFAREIMKKTNKNVKIIDVTTEEYNAKAKRPKNSRLDKSSLDKNGFDRLPIWQDALSRFLNELL